MKKGFTLVELIGVIIILGIIAILAFPPMLNMIKNAGNEKLNAAKEVALTSAKQYVEENINDYPQRDGNVFCIELGKVIDKKFIEESLENMNENTFIKVDYINGKFEYKFPDNNQCTPKLVASNADKSGANKPVIESSLIPIKWNGSNWVKADIDNAAGVNQWYDYSNQMWANAIIPTEATINKYKDATIGTVIPESDIMQYFVWIPRFEYKYTNLGNQYAGGTQTDPGLISVNFINNNVTQPTSNDYRIHPAFIYSDEQLNGFWIGKFESNADYNSIKPNQSIPGRSTFITQYKPVIMIGIYSNNVDIHYINNREWGATAYLSQSKYGKYGNPNFTGENKKIFTNSYIGTLSSGMNNDFSSLAGCSGGSPTAKPNKNCVYTYDIDYYGTGASTTGTIYGVYDMVGGKREFVLGNYTTTAHNSITNNKFADIFTTSIGTTACNNSVCYGQGLSEIDGWYNKSITMPTSSSLFLFRGNNAFSPTESIWSTSIGGVALADVPTTIIKKNDIITTKTIYSGNTKFPNTSNLDNLKPSQVLDDNNYYINDYYATRTVIFR